MRRSRSLLLTTAMALAAASLSVVPATAGASGGSNGESHLEVYVGQVAPEQIRALRAAGFDHEDLALGKAARDGRLPLEVAMTASQAAKLKKQGVELQVKTVGGKRASALMEAQRKAGFQVFRKYSGEGGIAQELQATASRNGGIAELVEIGTSRKGQPILAVRVTKGAASAEEGSRPAVLYNGAQHAREWITPEMVRRLMHHVIDGYGKDPAITRLVETRELWFLPVANPDGYDFTFTHDRLWRKTLADNDRDGETTDLDGVDPNRNFPTRWGFDDEGSSPDFDSQTYRGPQPRSEPETVAMDDLVERISPEFQINYHSAAELLLYGTGWQTNTPTPDDVVYEALVGDDLQPAVPGYDPDLSAELYVTNGDTTDHMHNEHGTLAITPEMSTCQTASAIDKHDAFRPEECLSVFNFPDDERLVQQEFTKNVPMALSFADSAADPADPVSSVGKAAAPLTPDTFAVSHGTTQPVAVTARHTLTDKRVHYRVNGGREVSGTVTHWAGGERYGMENSVYYGEYRGTVTGTKAGDVVTVWFSGAGDDKRRIVTAPFRYTVASDLGGDVLVLAAEDRTGISNLSARSYVDQYVAAVEASGRSVDVYDVDTNDRTAPHHLGVLSHYDAVIWETGDDVIPREKGQPGGTTAELALDLETAVRDYVNEGGKLLVAGQYALFAQGNDGVYYFNPFEENGHECTTYGSYPCIPLGNDFLQYWLGAYEYLSDGGTAPSGPLPVVGKGTPFVGVGAALNAAGSAGNQTHTASYLTTSSVLPLKDLFRSAAPLGWDRGDGPGPYDPYTGTAYLYSQRDDVSYKRLSRTVSVPADGGQLTFQTSYSAELDWDYLFVEARPVGTNQWTTLPDGNGHTGRGVGESCPSGWRALHPQLDHYQGADCSPTGTTGEWHAATGSSNGWQEWKVDLGDYAGKDIELSISYVSDWGTQGLGVFLDDVTVPGGTTSFEDGLGGWTVAPAPPGSRTNPRSWTVTQKAFDEGGGVTTSDTVLLGFGVEGLAPADRDLVVRRSLEHLLGG